MLECYAPQKFFHWFEKITQIPRPSFHEEKICDFVEAFAVSHGLAKRFSGGKVRVTACREGEDVLITVWDNGEGISDTDLEELRLRLERGVDTEGRDGSIGLNNVHARIHKTFGADCGVTIDSREGEGTTVCVRFPAEGRRAGK